MRKQLGWGWLVVVGVAVVIVGGALPLLTRGDRQTAQPATSRPAALPDVGTIAFARNSGRGTFEDAAGTVYAVGKSAPVALTRSTSTCCLTPGSSGRFATAIGVRAPRGTRLVTIGRNGELPLALPGVPRTLHLTPGAWSPNGKLLALAGVDPAHPARDGVYVMTTSSRRLERLTTAPGGRPQRPLSYSPDGTRLLIFQRDGGSRFGSLYVTRPGGGLQRVGSTLVMCCYFGSPASWSPDGPIAFAGFTDPSGVSAVYVASADGGTVYRLTEPGEWTTSAEWSPRGSWIAFDRGDTNGVHHVYLVQPDTDGIRPADPAPAAAGSCCVRWSPDGRYLVYQHLEADDDHVALWVVNVGGPAHRVKISDAQGGYMSYAWNR